MLNDFFKFDENNTNLKTEIFAGLTTFLAMAYILGVNPVILGDAGMPQSGVFFATAFVSAIASILMGLFFQISSGNCTGNGIQCIIFIYDCDRYGKILGSWTGSSICF